MVSRQVIRGLGGTVGPKVVVIGSVNLSSAGVRSQVNCIVGGLGDFVDNDPLDGSQKASIEAPVLSIVSTLSYEKVANATSRREITNYLQLCTPLLSECGTVPVLLFLSVDRLRGDDGKLT